MNETLKIIFYTIAAFLFLCFLILMSVSIIHFLVYKKQPTFIDSNKNETKSIGFYIEGLIFLIVSLLVLIISILFLIIPIVVK